MWCAASGRRPATAGPARPRERVATLPTGTSTMKTGEKIALGLLAGAGALWGTRAWLRSRRRIELADRVVVITGASSGLGYLIAQHAAGQGARLVLAARDEGDLREAEADL